jgi:hypothetical protein
VLQQRHLPQKWAVGRQRNEEWAYIPLPFPSVLLIYGFVVRLDHETTTSSRILNIEKDTITFERESIIIMRHAHMLVLICWCSSSNEFYWKRKDDNHDDIAS